MPSYDIGKLVHGIGPFKGANPGNSAFNGNFASLFPGAYQVVQSDLGLTYGGTLLASGTTPPVITLTGTLSTTPVPITVSCDLIGALGVWTGTYSFDNGLTSTSFVSAATIPLTGKGTGLTLNIAAGTAAFNNIWKATCAGLADQSGNGKHATQATASKQPVITVGYNGKPGLLFSSANLTFLQSTVGSLLSFPYLILIIGRVITSNPNSNCLVGGENYASTVFQPGVAGTYSTYNLASGPVVNLGTTTAQQRWAAMFTNSTADSLRVGNAAISTGASAGNGSGTIKQIGCSGTVPGQHLDGEILAVIYLPGSTSYAAFDLAINSANGYGPGSILV